MRNDGGGAQTEERVRFVCGFVRRSRSSTGMRRAHLFSGASGGRRSASAAVDGATAIPTFRNTSKEKFCLAPHGGKIPIVSEVEDFFLLAIFKKRLGCGSRIYRNS